MKFYSITLSFFAALFLYLFLPTKPVLATCTGIVRCAQEIVGGCSDTIESSQNCSVASGSQAQCSNLESTFCGSNPCLIGGCSWSGGGANPTNTPVPPSPTSPPGCNLGWGSCGSCSSCGGPASQCVTDPCGACVWDPGSCGGGSTPTDTPTPTSCSAPSAPTGLTPNSQLACGQNFTILRWNAVAGADYYQLRVNDESSGWGDCNDPESGDVCTNVTDTQYTKSIVPGRGYGWWVHACSNSCGCSGATSAYFQSPVCPTTVPTSIPTIPPCSCSVNLSPNSGSGTVGGSGTWFQAFPSLNNCGSLGVREIRFSSSNSSVASVNPNLDSGSPYFTSARPNSVGSATIRSTVVTTDGLARCSDTSSYTVNPGPTSPPPTDPPDQCQCTANLVPGSASSTAGGPNRSFQTFVSLENCGSTTVSEVLYSSSNTGVASISPTSDNSSPYITTARPLSAGASTITSRVRTTDGVIRCQDSSQFNVSSGPTLIPTPPPTVPPTPTNTPIPTPTPVPDCSVNLVPPPIVQDQIGETEDFQAFVTPQNGTVDFVAFSSSNTGAASLSKDFDSSNPYTTQASALAPGSSTIRAQVFMGGSIRCQDTTTYTVLTPSCDIDLTDDSAQVDLLGSVDFAVSIEDEQNGNIEQVNFSSADESIASVDPEFVSAPSFFATTATGNSLGDTTITAEAIMAGAPRCSDTSNIEVLNPDPWFQAGFGDTISGSGNILSDIPLACGASGTCTDQLIIGDPGVAIAGGSIDTGTGTVSSEGWKAENKDYQGRIYDYDFFYNRLPIDFSPQPVSGSINQGTLTAGSAVHRGYNILHSPGDITITGGNINIGNQKTILFAEGDITIDTEINLNKGQGFFMAISKQDIIVNSNVGSDFTSGDTTPDIEGVYIADNNFVTQTEGESQDTLQLRVRGTVVAWGSPGLTLQRHLTINSQHPAEFFEYAPDILLNFPPYFSVRNIEWREVAP